MSRQSWKRLTAIAAGLVGVFFVCGLLVWSPWSSTSKAEAKAGSTTTTTLPPAIVSQKTIEGLTIRTIRESCVRLVNANGGKTVVSHGYTTVNYDIGALKGVPPRITSDALSTPLPGKTPQQKLQAQLASICRDPELGSTVANLFAHLRVGNVSLLAHNSWLKPFAGSASRINKVAESYTPLQTGQKKPTNAQTWVAVRRNLAWQVVAGKLDTMLTDLSLAGIMKGPSVLNYHLVGLGVGGLPEVGINNLQESLAALRLEYTLKGVCAPLLVIGFNVYDQRPEVFKTPTCKVPTHPGTTTTTTRPGGTVTTTTHPGGTVTTTTRPSGSTTTTTIGRCHCHAPTTTSPPPTTTTNPSSTTTTQPTVGTPTTSQPPATTPTTTTNPSTTSTTAPPY